MIILGIDPGTATTGFGVIDTDGKDIKYIDCGAITTSSAFELPERLRQIYNEMNLIIREYKPEILSVEKLYFFKNTKTAMTVAQAKGVILLAGIKKKLPIHQFTPLQIKSCITGYGRASKSQMQEMVKTILELEKKPKPDDAADALGAAITYIRYANNRLLNGK